MAKGTLVIFDMSGLKRLTRQIRGGVRGTSPGPIDTMLKRWGVRYLTFARRRYLRLARGGGEWPPLKAATEARRKRPARHRRKKQKRRHSILINTMTLLGALQVGAPGNEFRRLPGAIKCGFGGNQKHPEGRASIADIGRFHDQGLGNLPQRQIIVEPDEQTKSGMREDAKRCGQELLRSASRGRKA